jgi:hypothetical protein
MDVSPGPDTGPRVSPGIWWVGSHGEGHEHASKKETAPAGVAVLCYAEAGLDMEGADESYQLEPPTPRGDGHQRRRRVPPTTIGITTATDT